MKQVGVIFVTSGDPSVVFEPADGALNTVAAFVAPERAAVLRRRARPVLAMRTNQFHVLQIQAISQRVAVRGGIISNRFGLRRVTRCSISGSMRVTSARLAPARVTARGVPSPSVRIMSFVPLPSLP